MEKKISMDSTQIAQIATENEWIFYRERTIKDNTFFDNYNAKDFVPSQKEVNLKPRAVATYPLEYLQDFLDLAKLTNASHITLAMRTASPLRLSFDSEDKMCFDNGKPVLKHTDLYLAPRIDDDGKNYEIGKKNESEEEELERLTTENAKLRKKIERLEAAMREAD